MSEKRREEDFFDSHCSFVTPSFDNLPEYLQVNVKRVNIVKLVAIMVNIYAEVN